MPFDIPYWKAAIKAYLPQAKKDFKRGVYITLSAATILPLLSAFKDPATTAPAIIALWDILSGLGSNLLADKLQIWAEGELPDVEILADHLKDNIHENAQLRRELDELLKAMETINQTHTRFNEEDRNWFQETLEKELSQINSNLRNIYTDFYFENIAIENGDFVTGDKITYIYQVEDVTPLVNSYYQNLSARCQRLPLGIIDEKFIQPQGELPIRLQDVYTDLDATAIPREMGEDVLHYGWRLSRAEEGDREPILEAVSCEDLPYVILLGDTGSGKTTFINYLTYRLLEDPKGLPEILQNRPIIRLILRDVLPFISSTNSAGAATYLWEALEADIRKRIGKTNSSKVLLALQNKVMETPCLVMMDGLDEIPEAQGYRQHLIEAVQDFINCLAKGSRVILTARPYAYAQPKWQLTDFTSRTLKPFSDDQVAHFIWAWFQSVPAQLDEDRQMRQKQADSLIEAVQEKDYLGALASRPILLTLMTTLQTSRGKLPEDRAELYDDSVNLLIDRWQQKYYFATNLGVGATNEKFYDLRIQKVFQFGTDQIRKVMEAVAFVSHQKQQAQQMSTTVSSMQSADITRAELESAFSQALPDDLNPRVMVDFLAQHAGLLIAREPEIFTFPHRSFQEFLAACYILDQPNSIQKILNLIHEDLYWWRDVFLLAVGKQNSSGLDNATSLISMLIQNNIHDKKTITDQDWLKASLAGEGLLEIRLIDDLKARKVYEGLINRIREWLSRLVAEGHLTPKERLLAGDTLGRIGDFRKGVNVITYNNVIIPDIEWIFIPEGKFLMGSLDSDQYAAEDEKPQHTVFLQGYWISKYPVTNAQYSLFVNENCYLNKKYWTDVGWEWLKEVRRICEEEPYKKPVRFPDKPYGWNFSRYNFSNRPVVGISWFEAHAYALWLHENYLDCNYYRDNNITDCYVNIPSEEQWEKAIRGRMGLIYPWGNNWSPDTANIEEERLFTTSPVGMFPNGRGNEFGLIDGVGNVSEWTSTPLGNHPEKPICEYPNHFYSNSIEEIENYHFLIMRGSSFIVNKTQARCATRGASAKIAWGLNFGFRLCLENK